MLEKTKSSIKAELTKSLIEVSTCSDPAPMLGPDAAKVLKALNEDIKDLVKKSKSSK